jgi:hypothetical protein
MITIETKTMNAATPRSSLATLLALLHVPSESALAELAGQFESAHRLIESLPLTSAAYCFAQNWLTSARQLGEAGEYAAASYQVRQ